MPTTEELAASSGSPITAPGVGLLAAAVDPAADARLRASGFARRAVRLDPGEDCACGLDGHRTPSTRDALLDNVTLYWLSATGASSARLYWESLRDRSLPPVSVPTGCTIFPKEILRLSRRLVEPRFIDLRFYNAPERGGHFAALEQPGVLVDDLRTFFRLVR